MPNYVELADEGAARSAASTVARMAALYNDGSQPPIGPGDPAWGDDKFGDQMREQYPHEDIVVPCLDAKREFGDRLTELGEAVQNALNEITGEEEGNAAGVNAVHPPNL